MSEPQSRMLIVDGHAYAYRAFHAIRELSGPDGSPTNCIYGSIKMLAKMESRVDPSHLVVVWDAGLSPARTTLLPEYKAQRPSAPEGLHEQILKLQEWLPVAGRSSLVMEGCEADDVICGLARSCAAQGIEVVIASSDKDFMQLVGPGVSLLNPNDKTETLWQEAEVIAKTGVKPSQIVDYLSLLGDAVDNIPGAPGVGPKTAASLLADHGSIDNLLASAPALKSDRIREAILGNAEVLKRNQSLIRLEPIGADLPPARFALKEADHSRLAAMYAGWGFKTLRHEAEQRIKPRTSEQTLLAV